MKMKEFEVDIDPNNFDVAAKPKDSENITAFLNNDNIPEIEIIEKQWDDLFKEHKKISIIKEYLELQLKDVEKDLEAINKTILIIDTKYLLYRKRIE